MAACPPIEPSNKVDLRSVVEARGKFNRAIRERNVGLVKAFVSEGIDVNYTDPQLSPRCVQKFNEGLGVRYNEIETCIPPLLFACNEHRIQDHDPESIKELKEILKILLNSGRINVNFMYKNLYSSYDCPLHVAARHGYVEIVKLLVEHGADANFVGSPDENLQSKNEIYSPLMLLAENARRYYQRQSCISGIKFLLEEKSLKVNVNFESYRTKKTAVFLAGKNSDIEIVELLLEHGAKIYLSVPLPILAESCRDHTHIFGIKDKSVACTKLTKLLIKCGANVNETDTRGYTALMNACECGDTHALHYTST